MKVPSLVDAVIAPGVVILGDEDVAVRGDENVRRFVERVVAVARDPFLSQSHHEIPVGVELEDDVAPPVWYGRVADSIGNPHVAVMVDEDAVRPSDHAGAEAPYDGATLGTMTM